MLEKEVQSPQEGGDAISSILADVRWFWMQWIEPGTSAPIGSAPCLRFRSPSCCAHELLLPTCPCKGLDVSHSLQVLPREGESENHHCCQSFHFLAFKRLCASVIQTITFSLPPQIGLTDSILLCADKTAGKAERCKPKSVKLGTYILRVAVTFNDTKDNGNSGGNYFCSYSFRS